MAQASRKEKTESSGVTEATDKQEMGFAAEISKVLHLMIHSLYSNRDIFLRELISNASDACDKLRYESLTRPELMEDGGELAIKLRVDTDARSVTISDNGIGMNREDLIQHLGTIAKSGTQDFASQLTGDAKKDMSLIGQFGVGFYSSFMVADKVVVESRKAGETHSWRWESDGQGSFTIEQSEPKGRGTSITLTMKESEKEYLDRFRLRHITQTYSDHISFPIRLFDEKGEAEIVNEASALWSRPKSEITPEQYQEFYRHVAHSPDEPFLTLHNKAEGAVEYTNLLFVPSLKPFDLFHPERRRRVKLYVKRVYITEEGIELVPAWLRFLRGIIDSQDLPLNISRESLQRNPTLDRIRESITSRVLGELKKKGEKEPEAYAKFWENFGAVLKEGLCEGNAPREKILEVCRFASTQGEELTGLDAYVSRMQEGQEAIYFLSGDNLASLRHSPQIEGFRKRGIEVLLLTDHVDDFWTNVTRDYKGKPLRSVVRAGSDLEGFGKADTAEADATEKATPEGLAPLLAWLQQLYGEEVKEVRITAKLAESPVCLAVGEGDMDLRMERFLHEHKQLPKRAARILEINPDHPLIRKLAAEAENPNDSSEDLAWILLDQAKIAEGEPLSDAAAFNLRLNRMLAA